MTRKHAQALLSMFALHFVSDQHSSFAPENPAPKRILPPKKVNHRGHTKFIIDGKEIWALNEKNAVKKAKHGTISITNNL